MALLEARGLTVSYGGVHANEDIDLDCEAGRIVGLIGPNGAGKTTFIDAITGFTSITGGTVTFDGRDLRRSSPSARARLGLTRTFQSLELFEDLSVRDNLLAAADRPRWFSVLGDLVAPSRGNLGARERVEWALETMDLRGVADVMPDRLSHGQRKLVTMARAFASRPTLVLLDEPAAGLDTTESQALGALLRAVVDDGISLFLIDHDMGLVLGTCDDVYVLDFGRVIAHGPPAVIREDPTVIEAYLGSGPTEGGSR
ncbi:MAG: ABC transporter ATP-binding protein [Ilumatobacteraceae bacterium]